MSIAHIRRLYDIIACYDAILCDVWGVLHNGVEAAPGAAEALMKARAMGRAVALVTNAPRPPAAIFDQLAGFGITGSACDRIVSSGGVTRDLLTREGDAPFYHLGPARDNGLYAGLDAGPARFEDAHYILCTGPFDDETEVAEDYRPLLEAALARKLRLFCANPDLVVERGGRLLPCAGAIAALYEEMGGDVLWIGKPKPLIYQVACAEITACLGFEPKPGRILCIGDALRTDIAGAKAAGFESLFIRAGIHGHQLALAGQSYDAAMLEALAEQHAARPDMTMARLIW